MGLHGFQGWNNRTHVTNRCNNAYIKGIEADIDFCKRATAIPDASAEDRRDATMAIKDYEKDIEWAKEQLKAVAK